MTTQSDAAYLKRLGARILSEANDLKRTPAALAKELGIPFDTVELAIAGGAEPEAAEKILQVMADTYPVSLSALWVERDDTENGAKFMRAVQSTESSRVFDRPDRKGRLSPYYEYRDTAMSRAAPFKPEWIKELRFVDDSDPDNPDVAYNHGHLMHQQTFFIGEVNFYWKSGGRSRCAEMNTGDSNYITPFVPHSFTSRNPDKPGLIVAVTYAGQVRDAMNTFSQVGGDVIAPYAGDLRDLKSVLGARLKRHLAAESLSATEFKRRLTDAGLETRRAAELADAAVIPNIEEFEILAGALNVRPADLMVTDMPLDQEVAIVSAPEAVSRGYPSDSVPAYQLMEMARVRHQPQLKGFDLRALPGNAGAQSPFRHMLHEYVYNYGDVPIDVLWNEDQSDQLQPGDSAYFRPLTAHCFANRNEVEGRLVIVRVPGQMSDAAIDEFAAFHPAGRERALLENKSWF